MFGVFFWCPEFSMESLLNLSGCQDNTPGKQILKLYPSAAKIHESKQQR